MNIPNSAINNVSVAPSSQLSMGQQIGNALGLNNDVQYANNASLMNTANAFNNYMANTAYQRTVADMEKAGINPTIAFGLGKGQLDSSLNSATASTWTNSGTFGNFVNKAMENVIKGIADAITIAS